MTEEEVIKRRLLIDGDGTADDRRLNILQKNLIKWCNSDDSPEETQAAMDRMLLQLECCEFTVTKAACATNMFKIELQNYQNLSKKIKQDIEQERKVIEKTKVALSEAKTVRKNKMEYDILGKVISEQPDRQETGKKLDQLENELKMLKESRTQIERQMGQRRQQFHALVVIIHQLQQILDEDSDGSVPFSVEESSEVMEVDLTDKDDNVVDLVHE